jgi:hypothetical protein
MPNGENYENKITPRLFFLGFKANKYTLADPIEIL